jgi:hypothetical protein
MAILAPTAVMAAAKLSSWQTLYVALLHLPLMMYMYVSCLAIVQHSDLPFAYCPALPCLAFFCCMHVPKTQLTTFTWIQTSNPTDPTGQQRPQDLRMLHSKGATSRRPGSAAAAAPGDYPKVLRLRLAVSCRA